MERNVWSGLPRVARKQRALCAEAEPQRDHASELPRDTHLVSAIARGRSAAAVDDWGGSDPAAAWEGR